MNSTLREQYAQKFQAEYQKLNAAQKQAVDAIFGPVMVVAGPGTGKTQMLALRVCKILMDTDLDPANILCLTFTDAGAVAMRNRLLGIMGPDAHKVGIFTFHAFSNKIIRENPEYFGGYFDLQNADEVELRETIEEMINNLPLDHPLKRNTGNQLYDLKKFEKVFSTMKQEEWTPEMIERAYEEYAALLPQMEDYQYQQKYKEFKKGDPKEKKIKDELKRYNFVRDAAPLIDTYQQLLSEKQRIDFNDSILWVVRALKQHDELKLRYQEQYQFVLADEYQDTNGVQNDILFMLGDYDEKPNLFVVGDDDQAIYRFQGANLQNISTFKDQYQPEIVVLDINYRSRQSILDSANLLIENNRERLGGVNKQLIAGRKFDTEAPAIQPTLKLYRNPGAMEAGLIEQIQHLRKQGVPYKEIGVIYRNHKEAEALIQYFTKAGVPINVKKRVNILHQPEIKRILNLLEFMDGEMKYPDSKNYLLFEILHYDFWGLDPLDIGKIAIHAYRCSRKDAATPFLWRALLRDEAGLKELGIQKINETMHCAQVLENLIGAIANFTSQVLLEKLLNETGMMHHILKSMNSTWRLQLVNRFFDFVKDLAGKVRDLTLSDILQAIEKRNNYGVELAFNSILVAEDGINFMSAHGSKGLEFPYVFILNATKKSWLEKPNDQTRFPPTLFRKAGQGNDEDERRLFFVSMTRAEKELTILTCQEDDNGKLLEPLPFLSELGYDLQEIKHEITDQHLLNEYLSKKMSVIQFTPPLFDPQAIDIALGELKMNATGVTKFLKCPVSFYFENILRVPGARKAAPGYGNAIHHAMDNYFKYWAKNQFNAAPPLDILLGFFQEGMEKFRAHFTESEFKSHEFEGKRALDMHYKTHSMSWNAAKEHKSELKIDSKFDGIAITGIVDRLTQFEDSYEVYDYKSGKIKSGNFTPAKSDEVEMDENGGDYWRQAVFYRMLAEKESKAKGRFGGAVFLFINSDAESAVKKNVEVSVRDMEIVGKQIQYVYDKIKAHDFSKACNDCPWCRFVADELKEDEVLPDYGDEEREEMSIDPSTI